MSQLNHGPCFASNRHKKKQFMKTRLMVVGMAMLMSSVLFAQGRKHGGPHRGEHNTEKMRSALNLSDEQYAKVTSINEKYAVKFTEFRKDTTARKENRDAIKSLRTERENEIGSVLTPEQKTKWNTYREEQKKKHTEKREDHDAKIKAMKAELALTSEQESKLTASNEKFGSKLKEWHDAERKEKHGELQKLKTEHEAEVKSILSPEQFEKWKTMRKERNHRRK
jgi:Spy/CpxP family protein refolding chaperone